MIPYYRFREQARAGPIDINFLSGKREYQLDMKKRKRKELNKQKPILSIRTFLILGIIVAAALILYYVYNISVSLKAIADEFRA